jgi:hypothetical protein
VSKQRLSDEEILSKFDDIALQLFHKVLDHCTRGEQEEVAAYIRERWTCDSWQAMESKARLAEFRKANASIAAPTHYLDFSKPWPKKRRRF